MKTRIPVKSLAILLILGGCVLRLWGLDRLPGLNGDEAWLAVQAQHWLRGEAFTLRTPTHMFLNPLLFLTDAALLSLLPPSGWTLRLPVALWSFAGLGLFAWLIQRLWGDLQRTLLATALLTCLPLAVAYAHCAWDPSFLPLVAPLVWLPALRLADRPDSRLDQGILLFGVLACLWVHLTAALMLIALALGWLAWKKPPRKQVMLLALLGIVALIALAFLGQMDLQTLSLLIERPLGFLIDPEQFLQLFALPGQLLTGARAFSYFAGMPEPLGLWLLAAIVTAVLGILAWRLRTSERQSDRLLALTWLLLPLPWLLTSGLLSPQGLGRERYVMWLLVPMVLLIARSCQFRPLLLLNLAALALLLSGLWLYAVDAQLWPAEVHRTFRTARIEPKQAAMQEMLRRHHGSQPVSVLAEDWWLVHPLRYLLPVGSVVRSAEDPEDMRETTEFSLKWTQTLPPDELPKCAAIVTDDARRPILCLLQR